MKPNEITEALGLEPCIVHCIGERRMTPKGTLLNGNYPDTRWRYSERHTVEDHCFASYIDRFVDRLTPHKSYLHNIRATHGSTCMLVQFLGDGYFGDEIEPSTLAKLADLGVSFGIEAFLVPQTP
jgi:hypothetical protein